MPTLVEELSAQVEELQDSIARRSRAFTDLQQAHSKLQAQVKEALEIAEHDHLKWLAMDFLKVRELLSKSNETIRVLRADVEACEQSMLRQTDRFDAEQTRLLDIIEKAGERIAGDDI
jgi:hypothetical protein